MQRKRNITVQLDPETIRKAKTLAAQRGTSVSGLLASRIRESVKADDDAGQTISGVLVVNPFAPPG